MATSESSSKPTILIVDDDEMALETLRQVLEDDYRVLTASSGKQAVEVASSDRTVETVVMDIKMAGMDGIQAGREIRRLLPQTPIIFHTGYPGEYDEREIDENEKPFDFVLKGNSIQRLIRSVRNGVESYRLKTDHRGLAELGRSQYGLIGRSQAMLDMFGLIRQTAASDAKVMILGETGTGKELVARAIHNSSRCEKLAILNCNHKNPDLVESELFGHVKGAFTSADRESTGLFEYADGGTIFLDEIGDLDITTQAKLLRVVEYGEYQKVGSPEIRKADARVICATHRNLEDRVRDGKFRQDLYYRLAGQKLVIPPLRERKEDIPLLIDHFLIAFTSGRGLPPKIIDPEAIDVFLSHDWPGNVRDLSETIRALVTYTDSHLIFAEDVDRIINGDPSTLDKIDRRGRAGTLTLPAAIEHFEKQQIVQALTKANGNVSEAANELGIDYSTLYKKLKKHHLDHDAFRNGGSESPTA